MFQLYSNALRPQRQASVNLSNLLEASCLGDFAGAGSYGRNHRKVLVLVGLVIYFDLRL